MLVYHKDVDSMNIFHSIFLTNLSVGPFFFTYHLLNAVRTSDKQEKETQH